MSISEDILRARMSGLAHSLRKTAKSQHALAASSVTHESRAQLLGQAYMLDEAAHYVESILREVPRGED
jgi:DNA-binding transcriptional regulator YbjK